MKIGTWITGKQSSKTALVLHCELNAREHFLLRIRQSLLLLIAITSAFIYSSCDYAIDIVSLTLSNVYIFAFSKDYFLIIVSLVFFFTELILLCLCEWYKTEPEELEEWECFGSTTFQRNNDKAHGYMATGTSKVSIFFTLLICSFCLCCSLWSPKAKDRLLCSYTRESKFLQSAGRRPWSKVSKAVKVRAAKRSSWAKTR